MGRTPSLEQVESDGAVLVGAMMAAKKTKKALAVGAARGDDRCTSHPDQSSRPRPPACSPRGIYGIRRVRPSVPCGLTALRNV